MLADLVLYLHFAFVAFVVLGAACIVFGKPLGWSWTHNRLFRHVHLAAVVFVALEALLGVACPLTVWEHRLRGIEHETGFIAGLVQSLLYYDLPSWVFATAYIGFALFVLLLYRWSPPHARTRGAH